jgi:hypothetical protein
MESKETLQLYKEYSQPEREAETAQKIVALMTSQMEKGHSKGRMLRDVHSKGHGCVKAEFTVRDNLPDELRVGVFKEPRTFPALIRFSNAGALAVIGGIAADSKLDARGMAIKLLGVKGEKLLEDEKQADTHDFLLFTANNFFTADPQGFLDLMVAVTTNRLVNLWFLLTHPSITRALFGSLHKHSSLLELQYFSAVPYRFGSKAVKYSARPSVDKKSRLPDKPGDDYLRERLQQRLRKEDVYFDFMVQFQTHPYDTPIENGLIVWDEKIAPFRKVATIKILKQNFDSPEQLEHCDNLSFTPWHCLPEHRPLGSISRVRRIVYNKISEFRHKKNDVPRKEPTLDKKS